MKHQAGENLEKSFLKKIILHQGEFHWTEPQKEININGDLFDVKSYSVEDGTFIFTGRFDNEETTLSKWQQDWKNNREQNKILTELFQVLQSVFHNSKWEDGFYDALAGEHPYLIPNKLPLPIIKITTPPPRA